MHFSMGINAHGLCHPPFLEMKFVTFLFSFMPKNPIFFRTTKNHHNCHLHKLLKTNNLCMTMALEVNLPHNLFVGFIYYNGC